VNKIWLARTIVISIIVLVVLAVQFKSQIINQFFAPTSSNIPDGVSAVEMIDEFSDKSLTDDPDTNPNSAPTNSNSPLPDSNPIQVIATSLNIPWEIAFLPDSSLLVTERPGQLLHISADQQESIAITGVVHQGEAGLQGLALHPDFSNNNLIYLYLTTATSDGLVNRVERYFLNSNSNQLSQRTVILDNIPGARFHDGGRIKFGPDKMLYITTGDATQEDLAQDLSSLAGKILRITPDGNIPTDNPFNSPVYSYGHRNVQGIAWDSQDQLWATEHGPSGLDTGQDELNLILPGQNYGWPIIRGNQTQTNLISPVIQSGTKDTWAPAGLEIIDNKLFFTGLRGEALYQTQINGQQLSPLTAHFREEFGRLRFVSKGPDGWLYLGTSNTDGRGNQQDSDDKIFRINPKILK
jgi:glucose/arabinose dehydrogenase